MTGSSLLVGAAQTALGALGLGTSLYGIGFIAIRAHYASLGIWPGSLDNQEITEEGGRFLYHLLFLPSSLLSRVGWKQGLFLLVAPVALSLVARATDRARGPSWASQWLMMRTTVIAVALLISAVLVETVWTALQIHDLLFASGSDLAAYRAETARLDLYQQVLWRLIVVAAISIWLRRFMWARAGAVDRLLIVLQQLLVAAAIAAWPMVYGSLVISDLRPGISGQLLTPATDRRFLVRRDGTSYLIWNKTQQRVEIWTGTAPFLVTVGAKEHLLE
jgi:hypothetical protein